MDKKEQRYVYKGLGRFMSTNAGKSPLKNPIIIHVIRVSYIYTGGPILR